LHRASASAHDKKHKAHAAAHVIQGQRTIDPDRTREIQTALIQRNYLAGTATGEWSSETEAAMAKFQSDNGWQTKLTPDSRALIKLGLGPNSLPGAASDSAVANANATPASTDANTLATVHSILN
jgi:peptidoglycan hydrolase-like protein with peptidoglycan-binding domain